MAYAAGILLLSWYKGRLYTLLGKDYYGAYSDFGGKNDEADRRNVFVTAARETYEETCGAICSISEWIYKLYDVKVIRSLSYTNKPYYMHVVFIKYDEKICEDFDNILTYIQHIPNLGKFKEKKQVRWFLMADVLKQRVELRNVFQRTIENNKHEILEIAYKDKSRNTFYNNEY